MSSSSSSLPANPELPPSRGDSEPIAPRQWPQPPRADVLASALYVVSTPIGNLRDITLRALDTLSHVDEVLAEDTRQARKLLDAFGLKTKVTPYHDHNGAQRRPEIIERLVSGARLALVSDAGTPLISDPGYKLVREASAAGISVIPIPGASAPLAALVTAGLPTDRFLFVGFPPPKAVARERFLEELADVRATLIVFETGPRLAASLSAMAQILGEGRDAAIARELTKLFEEVRRAPLGELARHYAEGPAPKGEIVVLVGPPVPDAHPASAAWQAALERALQGAPLREAVAQIVAQFGLARREVYQHALRLRDTPERERVEEE
jgi:16S rRNA (cytidine1402-2'-O)-methyltransferase